MTDTKHTPGPWTTTKGKRPIDGEFNYAIKAGGNVIAEVFGCIAEGTTGLRQSPAKENAVLIAAAPDLLVVLKLMVENFVRPRRSEFFEGEAGEISWRMALAACLAAMNVIADIEGNTP